MPVVREEIVETAHGMGADAVEDVAEIGQGVDLESVAGGDEAGEDGGSSPPFLAAEEEPILSSNSDSPYELNLLVRLKVR